MKRIFKKKCTYMKVLVQSQQASAELIKMFEELFLRYGEIESFSWSFIKFSYKAMVKALVTLLKSVF